MEKDDDTLTTTQIAEIVGKTVRELGQPALAEAFTATPRESPRTAGRHRAARAARCPAARVVRDLAARLRAAGYLFAASVGGSGRWPADPDGTWTPPGELEACVVGPFVSAADVLADLRSYVGGCAVFDGPEYWLSSRGGAAVAAFVPQTWAWRSALPGLRVVLNLNSAEPPSWAGELARGPLFAEQHTASDEATLASVADAVLEQAASVPIAWHLAPATSPPTRRAERCRRVAEIAAAGAPLTFVFDRPRRPLLLAAGMDRQHPAVLLTVGLHLPRLAEQAGSARSRRPVPAKTRQPGAAGDQRRGAEEREYLRRLERSAATWPDCGPPRS